MPSITSYTSQIPSNEGYFKGDTAGVSGYVFFYPIQSSFNFAVGTPTGCTGANGTSVYFDTYANVRSWISNGGTATKSAILDADFYRDMGKTITVFVQQEKSTGGYIYNKVATLTKVQKYVSPGERTEGPTGNVTGASTVPAYNTGYLITWTANQNTTTGLPVGVTRIGYQ